MRARIRVALPAVGAAIGLFAAAPARAALTFTASVAAGGGSVMSENATIPIVVGNAASSTDRIGWVELRFDATQYDIVAGSAPAGWVVEEIDKNLRRLRYRANDPCSSTSIAPAATATFGAIVRAVAAAADATDTLVAARAMSCARAANFLFSGALPSWPRRGLSSSLSVSPQSAGPGATVTVTLALVNRTTGSQSAIAPAAVTVSGTASAAPSAGPTPASISLASNASGSIQWAFVVSGSGTVTFTTSAGNGAATSPAASASVPVSSLSAALAVSPTTVISGQTVTVSMTVSNNSAEPISGVSPAPLTFTGNATAGYVSGPTPGNVPSLSAGSSTGFGWKYTASGTTGQTYSFRSTASATQGASTMTSNVADSNAGSIGSISMSPSPLSVVNNSTNFTESFTVSNNSGAAIQTVKISNPDTAVWIPAASPFVNDTSGWTATSGGGAFTWQSPSTTADIPHGSSKTFSVTFSKVGPVSATATYAWPGNLTDRNNVKNLASAAPVTVVVAAPPPDVSNLTATAGNARNTLFWTNPSVHDGVLVLRAVNATPDTAPQNGVQYAPGDAVGNATVAYIDAASYVSSLADQSLTNGTNYVYKVYNHDPYFVYSSGAVPTSSGLASKPTTQITPDPAWCYSVGSPSLSGPVAVPNGGIYSAFNAGRVTANYTSTANASLDGTEKWRPVVISGGVQSRFPAVPLANASGWWLLVGDQAGYAYALNAETGARKWTSAQLGDRIQAPLGAQLYNVANSAFRAIYSGYDLVFVATRNSSTSSNKVYALRGDTGATVWTFAPGNMDIASGSMSVDYTNNQLIVGSRGSGGQPSVWILDTLTGAAAATLALGDVDQPVSMSQGRTHAYVVSNGGTAYSIDVAAKAVAWSGAVGSPNSFLWPNAGWFYLTTSDGYVKKFQDNGTAAPTLLWQTALSGVSGLTFNGASFRLYAGSNLGRVYQIDPATGSIENSRALYPGSGVVGTPSSDNRSGRVHVGTLDGRLCAFSVPF